jgi:sodium-dependent dicarboxylate transporter 2/3/5
MVLWWVIEIIPLGITALLPIVYLPILNLIDLKSVTESYSNPVIYLFLGGFIIARALEKTRLSERIALWILSRTGHSDRGVILGFIIATALLSMWISNTATTVMMTPIALSVVVFLDQNLDVSDRKQFSLFKTALFLSIAYSANIGGVMTPVGTPPNVVLLGYLEDLYSRSFDFWKWMVIGVPVGVGLLVCMFFLLVKIFPFRIPIDNSFKKFVKERYLALGKVDNRQKLTIGIFAAVCLLWTFKGLIHYSLDFQFLNDTSIAIAGGVLLFLFPSKKNQSVPILDIKDISHLPWNIVLLFGGGMAVAGALNDAGLIQLATTMIGEIKGVPDWMLISLVCFLALFLTEIMSNVALCVVALPVLMNLSVSLGYDPLLIGIPVALCTSFAFSLPISTPPNAIVFGTNEIKVKDMIKVGVILNLIGLVIVLILGYNLAYWFLEGQ